MSWIAIAELACIAALLAIILRLIWLLSDAEHTVRTLRAELQQAHLAVALARASRSPPEEAIIRNFIDELDANGGACSPYERLHRPQGR